jgi:hypothetical protein
MEAVTDIRAQKDRYFEVILCHETSLKGQQHALQPLYHVVQGKT